MNIWLGVWFNMAFYRISCSYLCFISTADIEVGRTLEFPKGSMVAIDRGYNDYAWYNQLTERGIFFVARLKSSAKTRAVSRRPVLSSKRLSSDQTIEFTGAQTAKKCRIQLRRIDYHDLETGKHYIFQTNNFKLPGQLPISTWQGGRWSCF